MKWFYVCYDLDRPGRNYPNLWNALDSLGAKRVQDSVWLITRGSGTAKDLAANLRKHIDGNDRLVVIESADSAWYNLMVSPAA